MAGIENHKIAGADGEDLAMSEASGAGRISPTSRAPAERTALQFEVEQFLYHEAALLDDRKYPEWLDLIADDIHYWMPIRRTVTLDNLDKEFTAIGGMAHFDDDKNDLRMRVEKLQTGSSWSEDPPSRTRHFVSNVRIVDVDGDEIAVELAFHIYRSRLNSKIDDWIGKRQDRLRRAGTSFQICQRHIFLDQTVIRSTNLSNLF